MANPDEEGSFHVLEERSPAVKIGEEFKFTLGPSSELQLRLAEVERKLGIPRDPIRYPKTTIALPNEGVKESPGKAQGTPPNPLQFIQGIIDGLPPLKLPPLPPLLAFPTTTSPTKEAEKGATEVKTESVEEVSDRIIPLVFE